VVHSCSKRPRIRAFLLTLVTLAGLALGACDFPVALPVSTVATTVSAASSETAASVVIDDFESSQTQWVAGTWPWFTDSSATYVQNSTQHVTRGSQSMLLSFDRLNQPKAIYYLDRELDLSAAQTIGFDLYDEDGAVDTIAIAFRCGSQRDWQESRPVALKPGANAVLFDLHSATFQSAATRWQYTATPTAMDRVHQLAIVIYPTRSGRVYVDKLLAIMPAPPAAQNPPVTGAANSHFAIRSTRSTLKQYDMLELDIDTDIKVDNPFDPRQMSIDVVFTPPVGQPIRVPAFFYQDFTADTRKPIWPQTWKARYSPASEGAWSVRAELVAGRTKLASAPIRFSVSPGIARGFVRIDSANPEYLAFDNQEAFLPVGINLGWGHADPLADYARWFDKLKQNGANVTRIWMASWSFGIEWSDSGLGRYRLDRAWLLDQVLHMAEERGIYVILVLINHGAFNIQVNPEWDKNPYNAELGGPCKNPEDFATDPQARALFKQRLRYMAARWSYSPNLLAWEWWNEVNLTPLSDPNLLRPWLLEMTAYLHSVDPNRHLTSISYSDAPDPRIVNLPVLDTIQYHNYSAGDPRNSMANAYSAVSNYGTAKPAKPVLFTEYGYSSTSEQPGRFDNEGIQFHNGLWAALFTGFATPAMYWWWDSYIEPNDYWYHLQGMSSFVADQDLASLSPSATTVSTTTVQASALARNDRALLWLRNAQYSVDAAIRDHQQATLLEGVKESDWRYILQEQRNVTATLNGMKSGQYRVRWFDTRTGSLLGEEFPYAQDGRLQVTAPAFDRDVAAKIAWVSW
jgi:Cellulase (glycosyl hydrolase family 5)/Domain of unknown function (DUF5060)